MFHLESLMMIMAYCRKQGTGVWQLLALKTNLTIPWWFQSCWMCQDLLIINIYIYIEKLTCSSGIIHHFYLFGPRDGRDCGSDGLGLPNWLLADGTIWPLWVAWKNHGKTHWFPIDFLNQTKQTPILDATSCGAEAEALRRCEDMAEAQSEAKMEMDNMFGSWARLARG